MSKILLGLFIVLLMILPVNAEFSESFGTGNVLTWTISDGSSWSAGTYSLTNIANGNHDVPDTNTIYKLTGENNPKYFEVSIGSTFTQSFNTINYFGNVKVCPLSNATANLLCFKIDELSAVTFDVEGTTYNAVTVNNSEIYTVRATAEAGNILIELYNDDNNLVTGSDQTVALVYTPASYDRVTIINYASNANGFSGGTQSAAVIDNIYIGSSNLNLPESSSVNWDAESYQVGSTATLTAIFNNLDHTNHFYNLDIVQPDGENYYAYQIMPNLSSLEYDLTNIPTSGIWRAYIKVIEKSDGSMSILDFDFMTVGTGFSGNWIVINQSISYMNNLLSVSYGISDSDYDGGEKINIYSNEVGWFGSNVLVGSYSLGDKNGTIYTSFSQPGTYFMKLESFHYYSGTETLAEDMITITNYDPSSFSILAFPKIVTCGDYVNIQISSDDLTNPDYYIIKKDGSILVNYSNVQGLVKWRTNATGYYSVELYDGGQMQISDSFEVFGTCNGYNVTGSGGSNGDGIQPKDYPQIDQAASNGNLQNNLLYFLGLPIFWGLIIYVGVIYMLATSGAGSTVPFVTPVIIFMELAIGMLDPYSAFVVVGVIIVYVFGFIAKVFSISVGDTVSSVTHIGKK